MTSQCPLLDACRPLPSINPLTLEMKLLYVLAPVALASALSAQGVQIQLPQSADLTITPGAMPLSVPASGARATTRSL